MSVTQKTWVVTNKWLDGLFRIIPVVNHVTALNDTGAALFLYLCVYACECRLDVHEKTPHLCHMLTCISYVTCADIQRLGFQWNRNDDTWQLITFPCHSKQKETMTWSQSGLRRDYYVLWKSNRSPSLTLSFDSTDSFISWTKLIFKRQLAASSPVLTFASGFKGSVTSLKMNRQIRSRLTCAHGACVYMLCE